MKRSRRIVLVSHCLLNANAKVEGLARYAGVHPVIQGVMDAGYGILQLPCPEMRALGMKRWAQTVEQYDHPAYVEHCDQLADEIALQVAEYLRCGYAVGPVIGFEGSPSCGVRETSSGDWGGMFDKKRLSLIESGCERIGEPGLFMRSLLDRLEPMGVRFDAVNQRDADADDGVARILAGL